MTKVYMQKYNNTNFISLPTDRFTISDPQDPSICVSESYKSSSITEDFKALRL